MVAGRPVLKDGLKDVYQAENEIIKPFLDRRKEERITERAEI